MKMVDCRTAVEVISSADCVALLAQESVGRLAVVIGNRPYILPVNYSMDGRVVVFRTADGTKFDGAMRGPVAFEIDHYDTERRSGWSVIVHGRAEEVTAADDP